MEKFIAGEEKNGKSHNPGGAQGKPHETPPGGGLPDVSKTVRDVRTLWGKAVATVLPAKPATKGGTR